MVIDRKRKTGLKAARISAALWVLICPTISIALAQQSPESGDATATSQERPESWKRLIPNAANDEKRIWLFPVHMFGDKKRWAPALAVIGTTAALVVLDPSDARYFRRTSSFNGFNNVVTGRAAFYGIIGAPVALYTAGMATRNSKLRKTSLFAAEALLDTYLVTLVMKDVDRRLQPIAIPPNGNFAHTWFQDNSHNGLSDGSFPSGHEIAAMSVATVVSRRYPHHKWIPYVSYGIAGVVGFSRVTRSSHFVSDVFMGGALGYSISRFVVLQQ